MNHFLASADRYSQRPYRRVGRSGLQLPAVSLGFWHNFGDTTAIDTARAVARRAFDLGVTHFDLANNYGPPYGSAEQTFGRLLAEDFAPYRDEMIISTKAGYDMWPGPYGDHGSRKYMLASLDQSLRRTGLDYIDIYYTHRPDPDTPMEETMGALHSAVQHGKALYLGISSYSPNQTREAHRLLAELGTPLLIHQPSYSMLNRAPEDGLLATANDLGIGTIAFSPLAQGLLTDRYLHGIPADSRAAGISPFLGLSSITTETLETITALDQIAAGRDQKLAQMALSWLLRTPAVTSVLIGASSTSQLESNLQATQHLTFTPEELTAIDALVPRR